MRLLEGTTATRSLLVAHAYGIKYKYDLASCQQMA
jgi:hypothetical protein